MRVSVLELAKVLGTSNPADLMTKNVGKDLAMKHMRAMGIRYEAGRSEATAKLHALSTNSWTDVGGGKWRKMHSEARRELFTPCGADGDGGPGSPYLVSSTRNTVGRTASGKHFHVEDNWRKVGQGHRELEEEWIGYTEFQLKQCSHGAGELGPIPLWTSGESQGPDAQSERVERPSTSRERRGGVFGVTAGSASLGASTRETAGRSVGRDNLAARPDVAQDIEERLRRCPVAPFCLFGLVVQRSVHGSAAVF